VVKNTYAYITLNTVFRQDRISAFESITPGYTLLNAGFGGRLMLLNLPLELRLSANNLLDRTYISHLSRLKTDGISNIGRTISLGLKFEI
jgi:iron complex outermembrane receptor protein